MSEIYQPRDWRTQSQAVVMMKPAPRLLQNLIFNTRNTNASQAIEVDVVVGGQKMPPFVTEIAPGSYEQPTGFSTRDIKTPRIRPKIGLPAHKLMTQREAGQIAYLGNAKNVMDSRERKVQREFSNIKDGIERRVEWMCGQALQGALAVSQDDLDITVDYLIPAAHKVVLGAGSQWGDAGIDPLDTYQMAADIMVDAIGEGPNICIGGVEAMKRFRKVAPKSEWFDARRVDAGNLYWQASSNYIGDPEGIPTYRYGSTLEDAAGVKNPVIPTNKIYFVNTTRRFSIEYGLILDLEAGTSLESEYFAKAWMEKDPSVLWQLMESRPLPVIWEPESIVEVEVC